MNPNIRRRGVKIISFTGDEAFLDSLHSFPANFPFSVKLANCYIRGGDRVKERYAGTKPQRPKMAMSEVQELLRRNSITITNEALDEEERLANNMRSTNIASKFNPLQHYSCSLYNYFSSNRKNCINHKQDNRPTKDNRTAGIRTRPNRLGKQKSRSFNQVYLSESTSLQSFLKLHPTTFTSTEYMTDNASNNMEPIPDLIITTRSDHLPPGWDSHLFNDSLIFTDFSAERLEFVLLKTFAVTAFSWSAPSNSEASKLSQLVKQKLPLGSNQYFQMTYLTDIGLPTVVIEAKYEKDY